MAAEGIPTVKDAAEVLASKSEEDRHKILDIRIRRILEMPEEERIAAIEDMLNAEGLLPPEERVKIVKTRINVITELPTEKRDILMEAFGKAISSWTDDRKLMERRAILAVTQGSFILEKMIIRAMFNKMLD